MTTAPIKPLPSREWSNEIADPVYFINDQWAVTGYGLERVTEGHPYEWDADRLLATHDSGPEYPLRSAVLEHIGHKTWVDAGQLIEAFRVAILVHCKGQRLPFDLDAAERELWNYKRASS